ncbi:MAG: hypothetical protein Q9218_005172 [Villophora microphyllina]
MDPHGDKSHLLYHIFLAAFIFSSMALCLRIISRLISHQKFGSDDFLASAAWAFCILNVIFQWETLTNGAGRHVQPDWPSQRLNLFLVFTYCSELTYTLIVTLVKASILCLYKRLFGQVNQRFAAITAVFQIFNATWCLTVLVAFIFQCSPIDAAWDWTISRDKCFDYKSFLIGINVPNIALDFCIIALPAVQIQQLHVSPPRKAGLMAVFLLSLFATIVSCYRLHVNTLFDFKDPTWNLVKVMVWSTVEYSAGVVSCCLPVMAPVFRVCAGKKAISDASRNARTRPPPNFAGLDDRRGSPPAGNHRPVGYDRTGASGIELSLGLVPHGWTALH